jgi:hypothetical protein
MYSTQKIGDALTNFESGVSPWSQPSEWLKANTSHIRSTVHILEALTSDYNLETVIFKQPMIYEVCEQTFMVSNG